VTVVAILMVAISDLEGQVWGGGDCCLCGKDCTASSDHRLLSIIESWLANSHLEF